MITRSFTIYPEQEICGKGFITTFSTTPVSINDEVALTEVCKYPFTWCQFHNGSSWFENFISCDNLLCNLDNDHSDNPDDWFSIDQVKQLLFDAGIGQFAIISSWHDGIVEPDVKSVDGNMIEFDESPRPRFHILFILSETITDVEKYKYYDRVMRQRFPFCEDRLPGMSFGWGEYGISPQVIMVNSGEFIDNVIPLENMPDVLISENPEKSVITV